MIVTHSGFQLKLNNGAPLKADTSYQYQLIRLLLGTASILKEQETIRQRLDYSYLPPLVQSLTPGKAVTSFFDVYGIEAGVKSFITSTSRGKNREFYKDLLYDWCGYFLQTSKGCHTSAFVFIYRILERMLYSVPLIYVSTHNDFIGTFNSLKEMLKGKDDGEYSLYEKIIREGKFIDRLKLDVMYPLDFSTSGAYKTNHFNIIERYFKSEIDSPDGHACTAQVKMMHIGKLIYTTRNRFFHTRTGDGQKNIKTHELGDTDVFFKQLNNIFISYLSIVALEIISQNHN